MEEPNLEYGPYLIFQHYRVPYQILWRDVKLFPDSHYLWHVLSLREPVFNHPAEMGFNRYSYKSVCLKIKLIIFQ